VSRLSLRLRLTLAFALAMAVVLAAVGMLLYWQVRSALDEQIDQSLRVRAIEVASFVRRTGSPGRLAGDESFAQVIGPDGRPPEGERALLSPAQLAQARRVPIVVEVDRPLAADDEPDADDERVRLLAMPVRVSAGATYVVVAGAELDDRDETLVALRTQLLIGGPLALLLASLAGYGLAAATLRPVEAMRRRAEEISAATAGRRLPVPAADDEIARLARTLNEMLARLEAGLERERRFVADASHELRTPLSLLKAELELALRRPRSPDELLAALASAAEETDRLVALADTLLVLARSDEGRLTLAVEPVPVDELLAGVARRFAARAGAGGRAVEVAAPAGLLVDADRLRLEQALGNVVDNALRYGEGTVRLEAAPADGLVELRVSDEGSGFPAVFLPRAFERFSRADESRARGSAGLGLALVEAVARAHGGRAVAATRPGGGAEVTLSLPAHP
jgi:heavy metal sensor kinase